MISIYSDPDFLTGMNEDTSGGTAQRQIRQGCPLSPYLFFIALSVVFTEVDQQLLKGGVATNTWSKAGVWPIEYADDTLLMARNQTLEAVASLVLKWTHR